MPTYKVQTREKLRTMGIYDAESREEAKEMFRKDYMKIDWNQSGLLHLTSGYNPRAYIYNEEEEDK